MGKSAGIRLGAGAGGAHARGSAPGLLVWEKAGWKAGNAPARLGHAGSFGNPARAGHARPAKAGLIPAAGQCAWDAQRRAAKSRHARRWKCAKTGGTRAVGGRAKDRGACSCPKGKRPARTPTVRSAKTARKECAQACVHSENGKERPALSQNFSLFQMGEGGISLLPGPGILSLGGNFPGRELHGPGTGRARAVCAQPAGLAQRLRDISGRRQCPGLLAALFGYAGQSHPDLPGFQRFTGITLTCLVRIS